MSDGPFQQKQIGAYAPQTAREVLDHVRYMQRTGFVPRAGVKLPQNPAQALPLYFRNVSGSTMPAYACMQITGTVEIEGQNYLQADQPQDTTGNAGPFLWNKSVEVADDAFGTAIAGPHIITKFDSGITISAGVHLGPQVNSWEMELGTLVNCCGTTNLLPNNGQVARAIIEDDATILCKAPSGGCPARTGTTASQTTCDLYVLNPTSGAMTDSGNDVTIFNVWSEAVGNSAFFTAQKLYGVWVPTAEDCAAS